MSLTLCKDAFCEIAEALVEELRLHPLGEREVAPQSLGELKPILEEAAALFERCSSSDEILLLTQVDRKLGMAVLVVLSSFEEPGINLLLQRALPKLGGGQLSSPRVFGAFLREVALVSKAS